MPVYPFVLSNLATQELRLPRMKLLRQEFAVPSAIDVEAEIVRQWPGVVQGLGLKPDQRVAVAVGSRGIGDLVSIVRCVIDRLKRHGCHPFIVPAMGTHGGATPEGQVAVLAMLGITEQSVGAPLRATMDVVRLGDMDGIPLFMDRIAHDADGIVLINRVKPHTDFVGVVESGPMKMLAIGLGNQASATAYHRLGVSRGLGDVILSASRALLNCTRILFAVAVVENQDHQATMVRLTGPDDLEHTEAELLAVARRLLPTLPIEDIDLLVVDEMGKEVSGAGLDPNVTGRTSASWMTQRDKPRIGRVFVRDLTAASEGNAIGLGAIDAITTRIVEKIDFHATTVNALGSCAPEDCRVPLTLASDRDAISTLLLTLPPRSFSDLRLVFIKNTLELSRLLVSPGCLQDIAGRRNVTVNPGELELHFDPDGNLSSWWNRS